MAMLRSFRFWLLNPKSKTMEFTPEAYKLIFWDFDGVIKDSVPLKTEAFDQLFREYDDEVRKYVREYHLLHGGVSRHIKIPHYFRTLLDQELSEEENLEYCQRYADSVIEGVITCPWIEGAREFLNSNPHDQQHMIVTGTPQAEMEHILKAIDLVSPFSKVFGAPHRKPEVLAQMLAETKMEPEECLMIGDSMTDHDAAVENQVPFLLRENDENREHFAFFEGPKVSNFLHWL
jgi:HAD superfamily hydrolase (TIGR01549 family)